jgi:hypothetical protein
MAEQGAGEPVMESDASQNEKLAAKPQESVDPAESDAHLSSEERKEGHCMVTTNTSLHFLTDG